MTPLERYVIRISESVLADLHERLSDTRWSRGLHSRGWDAGMDLDYLKAVVAYWRDDFDWRQQEQVLNDWHHFKTRIDGVGLHFIHERGSTNPMPLLLLHGWPDSFLRFCKLIPMLTDPGRFGGDPDGSFDVIVPSLPGFGFTDLPADHPHTQVVRHDARLLHTLMTETLGYQRFGVVGGDGGSALAQVLAIDFPGSICGIYLTDLGWHVFKADPSALSRKEQRYLAASQKAFMKQGAYAMLQATKPQTLAYSLNDSPAGLAAWILDRFHFWTDGNIEERFTRDELLTNITIYWATQTIASSIRVYCFETVSPSLTSRDYVHVPVGLGLFPKDTGGIPPRQFAERTLHVQHWTEMPRGGHFTAWEEPELMVADVRKFFGGLPHQHAYNARPEAVPSTASAREDAR